MNNLNKTEILDNISHIETNLPTLIKDSIINSANVDEKMSLIFATITATGALLTNVTGTYAKNEVSANLFLFAVAPPASGKGKLIDVRRYLELVQQSFSKKENDKETTVSFSTKNLNKTDSGTQPKRAPKQIPIIPGNITKTKMIDQIYINGDSCPSIIFETEADSISSSNKGEHGNFSDILRKAFHNEPISFSRRLNNETIEITKPKFSLILSGTPRQIHSLIPNSEDGLFSRFLFYRFEIKTEWSDVSPCIDCEDNSEIIKRQQIRFLSLWKFFEGKAITIGLTMDQWERLNAFGKNEEIEAEKTLHFESKSIIRRHGLMLFKMCMVLTAIRCFEKNDTHLDIDTALTCSDDDFNLALFLIQKSLECAQDIVADYPDPDVSKNQKKILDFFKLLPPKFNKQHAMEQSSKLKISTRTTDRWLKHLIENGALVKPMYDCYQKQELLN